MTGSPFVIREIDIDICGVGALVQAWFQRQNLLQRREAHDPMDQDSNRNEGNAGKFRTTHWSVVLAASEENAADSEAAMAQLCEMYRYPVYAFIRRSGRSPEDAEDLTQDFFTRLLEKKFLEGIQRDGGKFRSFLLVSVKRFLANQWERSQAQKRGGGRTMVSLDQDAEERYRLEPSDPVTPERLYERRWAFTLLDQVMESLKCEYEEAGKAALFRELQPQFQGRGEGAAYAAIGERLAMSESAVKVAAHRMRKRYNQLLREEISRTVDSPEEMKEEMRHLMSVSIAFGYTFS